MAKYSKKLSKEIDRIIEYYEEHDNFNFLQKIVKFMAEGIEYIDEKYFIISKEQIKYFVTEAMKIWEKDGSPEKLKRINVEYTNKLSEIKPFREILENKEEKSAMNCVLCILENGHDDPTNQFVYDFIELQIFDLEKLNIEEKIIKELMEKYFGEIIGNKK
jgi:hypothetical protein